MTNQPSRDQRFIFPPWTNRVPAISVAALLVGFTLLIFGMWYYFSPRHTDVGYEPIQPIPYSHKLHAGELGLDCRYCHVNVERTEFATVPPTQVCMNCHSNVQKDSAKLQPLRESWAYGKPVPWVRVHKTPDYAYFPHSRHVKSGVGCVECHGRVERMEVVRQVEPLSMGWCLDCHRDPAPRLRPLDQITNMGWEPPGDKPLDVRRREFGEKLAQELKISPPTDCSRCHR